jgi:hypothetical protein
MVSTIVVGIAITYAYVDILGKSGTGHALRGWLLGAVTGALVLATIKYWRRWFFYIPGYFGIRTSLGLLLGWASPIGYIFIVFPVLMLGMAVLTFRFSRPAKLGIADRIILVVSLLLMSCAVPLFLSAHPRPTSLAFVAAPDVLLLLARAPSAFHAQRRTKGSSALGPNH